MVVSVYVIPLLKMDAEAALASRSIILLIIIWSLQSIANQNLLGTQENKNQKRKGGRGSD